MEINLSAEFGNNIFIINWSGYMGLQLQNIINVHTKKREDVQFKINWKCNSFKFILITIHWADYY